MVPRSKKNNREKETITFGMGNWRSGEEEKLRNYEIDSESEEKRRGNGEKGRN